jgi:hypothetical protein
MRKETFLSLWMSMVGPYSLPRSSTSQTLTLPTTPTIRSLCISSRPRASTLPTRSCTMSPPRTSWASLPKCWQRCRSR